MRWNLGGFERAGAFWLGPFSISATEGHTCHDRHLREKAFRSVNTMGNQRGFHRSWVCEVVDVAQFADVAGPIVSEEDVHDLGRHGEWGRPVCLREPAHEVLGEFGNVAAALAQSRSGDAGMEPETGRKARSPPSDDPLIRLPARGRLRPRPTRPRFGASSSRPETSPKPPLDRIDGDHERRGRVPVLPRCSPASQSGTRWPGARGIHLIGSVISFHRPSTSRPP